MLVVVLDVGVSVLLVRSTISVASVLVGEDPAAVAPVVVVVVVGAGGGDAAATNGSVSLVVVVVEVVVASLVVLVDVAASLTCRCSCGRRC